MTPEEIQKLASGIAVVCRENWDAYCRDGVTYENKTDCFNQTLQNMLENEEITDKKLKSEIAEAMSNVLREWLKDDSLPVFTEETEGGQKITITENNPFPVRVDLQGVHICTTLDENYVEMSLQDMRELSRALQEIISRYDHDMYDNKDQIAEQKAKRSKTLKQQGRELAPNERKALDLVWEQVGLWEKNHPHNTEDKAEYENLAWLIERYGLHEALEMLFDKSEDYPSEREVRDGLRDWCDRNICELDPTEETEE